MMRASVLLTCVLIAAGCTPAPNEAEAREPRVATPDGWTAAQSQINDLIRERQHDEAVRLAEQWVAQHPDFADAHAAAGDANRFRAGASRDRNADELWRAQLTTAAAHYKRYREIETDPAVRAVYAPAIVETLLDLDQRDEAERVAREQIAAAPADHGARDAFAGALRRLGREQEAGDWLRKWEPTYRADSRFRFLAMVNAHVYESRDLAADEMRTWIEVLREDFDRRLAADAGDRLALTQKAALLELQAERVEADPARRKALIAEAAQLRSRASQD